jgi:hypothetical protein
MTTISDRNADAGQASPFTAKDKKTGATHDRRLHMTTISKMQTASRGGGKLSAVVAAMAALAVVTLGPAWTAGAAGNAPGSQMRSTIEDASSSSYLAGYQATPTGGLASASVTFAVPTISCTATDTADNAAFNTGVFTDSSDALAVIVASCASSGPTYSYFLATDSGQEDPVGGVAPGDVVVTSLFESATSTWTEIHNLTNGQHWYDNNLANQGDTTVDLGTFSFGSVSPVPTFSKIKFTNATVNGDYLGFDSPTQVNTLNGGDLLIKAGALTTSATGSSFSDTFKHAR